LDWPALNKQWTDGAQDCAVLREVFQLRRVRAACRKALARMAGKLEPAYENLLARLRAVLMCIVMKPVGGGRPRVLVVVFTNKTMTVYRVARPGTRPLLEILGPDFRGAGQRLSSHL